MLEMFQFVIISKKRIYEDIPKVIIYIDINMFHIYLTLV